MEFEEFPFPFLLHVVSLFAFHDMLTLRTMCISSVGGGFRKTSCLFFCFCLVVLCSVCFSISVCCFCFVVFVLFCHFTIFTYIKKEIKNNTDFIVAVF